MVAVALLAHYVLGAVMGLVLGAIIAPFHLDSSLGLLALSGAVFGVVLYVLNFYGMVRFFPWFAEWRGFATLMNHMIFGMCRGTFLCQAGPAWSGSLSAGRGDAHADGCCAHRHCGRLAAVSPDHAMVDDAARLELAEDGRHADDHRRQ